MRKVITLFVICFGFFVSCGTTNQAEKYTTDTDDEAARKALDAKDYEKAIELLEGLIEKDPTGYQRYPLLATAHAGLAKVDVFSVLKGQISGDSGGDGGGTIFDQMAKLVPDKPSDAQFENIDAAIEWLELMPESHRSPNGTYSYAPSSAFLLNVYSAISSTMALNKFVAKTDSGELDVDQLEEMSDEDVERILGNLEGISDRGDEQLGESVEEVLKKVDEQEGDSRRERLINYIIANGGD
jgi:hypothetical protein